MNIHENGCIVMKLFVEPLSTIFKLDIYFNNLVEAYERQKDRVLL